jgi:hypothetical protein
MIEQWRAMFVPRDFRNVMHAEFSRCIRHSIVVAEQKNLRRGLNMEPRLNRIALDEADVPDERLGERGKAEHRGDFMRV